MVKYTCVRPRDKAVGDAEISESIRVRVDSHDKRVISVEGKANVGAIVRNKLRVSVAIIDLNHSLHGIQLFPELKLGIRIGPVQRFHAKHPKNIRYFERT